MAVDSTQSMNQSSRRVLYGLNAAITAALVVGILVGAAWLAGRSGVKADISSAGSNSLSPRTVKLVKGLNENVTITGLYSLALKEARPYAEKHRNRVADLLDLYETAAPGKIARQMIDPAKQQAEVTALLKRLREKPAYRDESKPHAEALLEYPALNTKLVDLAKAEAARIAEGARIDEALAKTPQIAQIVRLLNSIEQSAKQSMQELEELKAAEIPRYQAAVETMKKDLSDARNVLQQVADWLGGNGASLPGISAEYKEYFAGANQRYQPVLLEVDAALKKIDPLTTTPVKLEQLYEQLKSGSGESVLIETASEAVALRSDEVWTYPTDGRGAPAADGDTRVFAGEQAISSAILRLTQKEKTGIIFVRFGGESLLRPDFSKFNPMSQQMPQAPMQRMNDLLSKENFATEEWDVAASPTPPTLEGVKRTVYVLTTPAPPPPQMPGQPPRAQGMTPQQRQAVLDAVNSSQMAIFLTGWQQPGSPFSPIQPTYEYADYLKNEWGIEVRSTFVTLEFATDPARKDVWRPVGGRELLLGIGGGSVARLTEHEIAAPLRALQGGMTQVAPLIVAPAASRPAGVTVEPVVEVPETERVWAFSNFERINQDFSQKQGTRRYDDDVAPPFPVVVAGKKESGARIVVFSSEDFVKDAMLDAAGLVQLGGTIAVAKMFPANGELFLNAIHWVTGNAGRIDVGPASGDVPRLTLKDDGVLTFWRVFLVAIWPAVALLIGGVIWMIRS